MDAKTIEWSSELPGWSLSWVAAETTGGLTQLWPPDAPADRFEALTAVGSVLVLSDDLQTDNGWTTENIDLSDGQWDRGVPAGGVPGGGGLSGPGCGAISGGGPPRPTFC